MLQNTTQSENPTDTGFHLRFLGDGDMPPLLHTHHPPLVWFQAISSSYVSKDEILIFGKIPVNILFLNLELIREETSSFLPEMQL